MGFLVKKLKYMGSKSRIAKYIVPIIQEKIDKNNITTYIEPFVGGCNVIDKIRCKNKIGSDKHKYLIEMLTNLDKIKTLPEFISKEHYSEVRKCFNENNHSFPDWYIGAVGFLSSYNGRFYDGGYSGVVHTKAGTVRNYYDEAKRNLENQITSLKDIKFLHGDYADLWSDAKNSLIYCDIPYQGTKQYGISKNFNYDKFWNWAEEMSKYNIVLVSEHNAPHQWHCIWEQGVKRTIDNTKRVKAVEKLFELKA